jgi:hypothetical protein
MDNSHAPLVGETTISSLLLRDNLAVSSFTSNSLQKKIDQIVKYNKEWDFKHNLSKSTIVMFKQDANDWHGRSTVWQRQEKRKRK